MKISRYALAGALSLALVSPSLAQTYVDSSGTIVPAQVPLAFLPNGNAATPLSVSNVSASVALPAGSTVLVQNTGTNAAYVNLTAGSGTATTSGIYIPAGGSIGMRAGLNTFVNAITASSTTTLNVSGGVGILAMAGGGSGSGGGSITQGTSPWVENVTQFGGSNVVTGTGVGGAGVPRVTVSSDSSLSLATGANTIGAISNTTFAATQSGTWNVGAITTLPATPAGTNTIGNVINAPTSSSSLAVSHASVTALGTSLVAKASAGNLYGLNCTALTGGAAGYCIAYNGTAAPSTGALTGSLVLDVCYFAAGAAGCSLSHGILPANYSTGIVILVTSAVTPFTYTTGTDTAFISADYN